jgi:hypothetical protein
VQLNGFAPNDAALEPYFALAEEFDVPVLIHTAGIGRTCPASGQVPVRRCFWKTS